MNKNILLALAPCTVATLYAQQSIALEQTDKRPNIILFMVDDMGWQDTSLPFWTQKTHYNEVYETPNMERLAAKGMMFTQAYAASISSPTR
ncbi:MAG: sulfatase-like hydrolase/transferase, partial [Bacteroidaceae bacterium]